MIQSIKAKLEIIGVNPYIILPDEVLAEIFRQAGKDKGPIPIQGLINKTYYVQTLVKFKGAWRLYINTKMLKNSPKRIGEIIELTLMFDPVERIILHHPIFTRALLKNKEAETTFYRLRPSLQLEIVRYISTLKTEENVNRNVLKAIDFLLGKGRFVGRDKP